MRSRVPLFALLFMAGSFALPLAAHAAIPFFGPIVPPEVHRCAAGWGAIVQVINNIISFLITLAIVFVAPIMVAYSGFLFVVNPVNASGKEKAKGILRNTLFGIFIALSGWMIVDAIMAVLYNPGASSGTTTLDVWSNIVYGDSSKFCLLQEGSLQDLNQASPGTATGGGLNTGVLGAPPSGKAGTACDPSVVLSAAASGGYSLTDTQANTFACIAKPETNCGAPQNPPNYNWNSAKSSPGSTAAGAFQVLLSTNHSCYENSACYTGAGVGGPLNCQNGFDKNGNPIPGSSIVQQCLTAAANINCSASAAACLLQKNGGSFSPWQQDVNSAVQTGCINNGG